jgi:hypothetical protein
MSALCSLFARPAFRQSRNHIPRPVSADILDAAPIFSLALKEDAGRGFVRDFPRSRAVSAPHHHVGRDRVGGWIVDEAPAGADKFRSATHAQFLLLAATTARLFTIDSGGFCPHVPKTGDKLSPVHAASRASVRHLPITNSRALTRANAPAGSTPNPVPAGAPLHPARGLVGTAERSRSAFYSRGCA